MFSVRHGFVVFFQIFSFLIVAFSNNFTMGIVGNSLKYLIKIFNFLGIIFASTGCGLGEVSYLSLSSHFNR